MRAQVLKLAAFLLVAPWVIAAGPAPVRAPYAGAYQPETVDERGLWMMADEDERTLRDSKFVVKDAALQAYVMAVLCKTVGDDRCRATRLYIVRDASFNASMAPNGMMAVHTGLLLRMRSEAELASVLAHEFGHFELRHSLQGFKRARTGTDIMAWASFLTNGFAIQTLVLRTIFAHDRAQEREADLKSAEYLGASRYRAASSADVWARLLDEADATAVERKRRSKRYRGTGFFDTHPVERDRNIYLAAAAVKAPGGGEEGVSEYRSAIASWWPALVGDQIALNDFGGSDYLLRETEGAASNPALLFARGELYRSRGNPRDLVMAAEFYRRATTGEAPAEAWRGLGLALIRAGQITDGKAALARYLQVKPDASDAPFIRTIVSE